MKSILIKTSLLAATVLLATAGIQANAASIGNTACYYDLIRGASWAPQSIVVTKQGHIQCPSIRYGAYGDYALSSQSHY